MKKTLFVFMLAVFMIFVMIFAIGCEPEDADDLSSMITSSKTTTSSATSPGTTTSPATSPGTESPGTTSPGTSSEMSSQSSATTS